MKITAILQARMASTRLPGKILMDLCGKPMLWHVMTRIAKSTKIDRVILATSDNKENDVLEEFSNEYGFHIFRGSEENVLERYFQCAKKEQSDIIVRYTGDNPLIDHHLADEAINFFLDTGDDYVRYSPGLPLGMHTELFTFNALEKTYKETNDPVDLEHVVPYMYKNPNKFKIPAYEQPQTSYADYRWTVDEEADFQLISEIYNCLYPTNPDFSFSDILKAYEKNPHWAKINVQVQQNKV